jgi:hypothetical protein
MKPNLIVTAMLFGALITGSAYAQTLRPGITAGASINSMKLDGIPDAITDMNNLNGMEAGLYMKISALNWYFRPMAVASFLRGEVHTTYADNVTTVSDFEMSTLEVPVLAGLHLLPGIALEAGPSWNYIMTYTDNVDAVQLSFARNSIGYRAGVRVTFSRFGLFGHYGGIITELDETDFQLERPSRIIFGATLDLGGGD